jgi:hypothetical protein
MAEKRFALAGWTGVTRLLLGNGRHRALAAPLLTTSLTRPISDAAIGRDDFTIGKRTF